MNNYLKKAYDVDDPDFVSTYDDLSLWAAPFGLKLLDTIKMRAGLTILDIGPGPGFPLIEIAQRFGSTSKVYGIDPWMGGIERINKKIEFHHLKNVEIKTGIAEELPFPNNFFDLIVSNNGMNNVQDLPKAFEECFRVSKHGNQFVFTMNQQKTMVEFYDIYKSTLKLLSLGKYIKNIDDHIIKHRPSNERIQGIMQKVGFKIDSIIIDNFKIRLVDGTALFNHGFIKMFFLPPWKKCVPKNRIKQVFTALEENLNQYSKENNGIDLTIPFVCYNCSKP